MRISVFLAPLALCFGVSVASAQPTTPARAPQTGTGTLNQTLQNAERTQNSDALLLAYGQAVTDPTLARMAIGQLLTNYYLMRNQAQTPEQATQAVSEATLRFQVLQAAQNQVLIQQNQQMLQQNARLIALMEGRNTTTVTRGR